MATFSERLRQLRLEAGLTQAQLARFLDVDPSTISSYETRAERLPPEDVLKKMADLFGVSLDYLLGRSEMRRGFPDPLDQEWPEAVKTIRWLARRATPEEKEFIITLLQSFGKTKDRERRNRK